MSHEDRIEALRMAVGLGGDPTSQIVPAAEAFHAFIVGDARPARSPVEKAKGGPDAAGSHPDAEIPVASGVKEPVAAKPVPGGKATPPVDDKKVAKPPTADEVRAALRDYAQREGQDAAMEILARFGSTNITKLEEKNYAGVVKACAPF